MVEPLQQHLKTNPWNPNTLYMALLGSVLMSIEDHFGWIWILGHLDALSKYMTRILFGQFMTVGSKWKTCYISILNWCGRWSWWELCRMSRSGHISVRTCLHFGFTLQVCIPVTLLSSTTVCTRLPTWLIYRPVVLFINLPDSQH